MWLPKAIRTMLKEVDEDRARRAADIKRRTVHDVKVDGIIFCSNHLCGVNYTSVNKIDVIKAPKGDYYYFECTYCHREIYVDLVKRDGEFFISYRPKYTIE